MYFKFVFLPLTHTVRANTHNSIAAESHFSQMASEAHPKPA